MQKCCVHDCAASGKSNPILHIFPNPKKELERYKAWVRAIEGDIDDWAVYRKKHICHRHFVSEYCRKTKLSNMAVPTLFMSKCAMIMVSNKDDRDVKKLPELAMTAPTLWLLLTQDNPKYPE